MASPATLDFAKLLAPIAADKPTGVDPRSDRSSGSLFYRIKDARAAARAAERHAVAGDETKPDWKPPDWKPVRQLATQFLAEQAKDLEITAYLIEALVRLEGFAGLRDGFRLARALVDKFWDGLYPTPDEEGLVTRIAPLVGLNGEGGEGTLLAPIARVPLTSSPSHGRLSQARFNEANSLKKITDPKILQSKVAQGAVSPEQVQKAVAETPPLFFQSLVDDLTACLTELAKLGEALDQRCGGRGPPTGSIRSALTACLDMVKDVARDKLTATTALPAAANGLKPAAEPRATPRAAGPGGDVLTREQVLENLRKFAEYFRRTEPQSIVSYALEQVVRWAKMPLPDLLTELITEDAPRKSLFNKVGIRLSEEPPKASAPKK
jgi:type VI secretion system protein ImpA